MKITGWYIDGFGIFHDLSVSGLSSDLVVFYGDNEAGKSTLLGFIRSILFGFPRANARDLSYPALVGGIPGGRMDVITRAGEAYSVSRKPGTGGGTVTVSGNDGTLYDKSMLDRLLGGVSYEAFRNIQAFGLSELSSIETLSGEHIAGAIYGAGFGTSMMAMPAALKTIRDRKEKLFKKKGKQPLNLLADRLEQIRRDLQAASLQVDRYDSTHDAFIQAEKEVSTCRDRLSLHRREQQRYETLERLWADWITFRESRRELAALVPPARTFPENGISSLDRLTESRNRHKAKISELTDQIERISHRLATLPVDEPVLARGAVLSSLVEHRNIHVENTRKLPLLTRETQHLDDTVTRLLQRLGNGWDEAAVLHFDRSLFTREIIRTHQTALDALERDLAATGTLFSDKQTAAHQATEVLRLSEKDLVEKGDLPPDRDPDLIRKLKQGRDRFADAFTEYRQVSSALDAARKELSLLECAAGQGSSGSIWPIAVVAALGVAGTGLALFLWNWNYRDASLLLGATLLATVAAWLFRKQQRQTRQYRQDQVRQQQVRVEELQTRGGHLESIRDAYERLAMEVLDSFDTDTVRGEALLAKVDRFISNLSEEERRREAILLSRNRLKENKSLEGAATQSLETVLATRKTLVEHLSEEKAAWKNRCFGLGLSVSLSPATALEALDTIEQTTAEIQKRDRSAAELSRIGEEMDAYRQKVREILSAVGWNTVPDDTLPETVTELAGRLEESKGNKRETETLDRQRTGFEKERTSVEEKLRETESSLRRLLEAVGAPDEAVFRETGLTELRRAQVLSAAETAEGNMRRMSGEIDIAALQHMLESLSLSDIRSRKETAARETRELDMELSRLYTHRAELKQTLETLSNSEEISGLRAEETMLLADLEENAAEWCRYTLAEHLILQAREVFEKKHQPGIIQDAGRFFHQMTGCRYQGIVSPLGENTLWAVSRHGERIPPEALSRGTAEQLYLSVRFGFIRHQAGKAETLPVIMDDILVNFDPVRARKAAEAIMSLSASHQILLFTCHPETTAVFQDIDPRIPIYRLDGGQIVAPEKRPGPEKI